jgi:hypothetical protein
MGESAPAGKNCDAASPNLSVHPVKSHYERFTGKNIFEPGHPTRSCPLFPLIRKKNSLPEKDIAFNKNHIPG